MSSWPAYDRSGVRAQSLLGIFAAASLIWLADFPWGDVQDHPHWDVVGWIPLWSPPLSGFDVAVNLLLGVPLGIAIGLRFRHGTAVAVVVTLVAALLGEWSQLYSHTRFPSATDIAANVVGAVVACQATARLGRSRPATDVSLAAVQQTEVTPEETFRL